MSLLVGGKAAVATSALIGQVRPVVRARGDLQGHLRSRPVRRPPAPARVRPAGPPVTACASDYARRRLVAMLILAVITAVVVAWLLALRAAAASDDVPRRTVVVEVRSGETLWDLAERVAPHSPPQAVTERIRELNGMRGSTVHPGQPLLVPDGR